MSGSEKYFPLLRRMPIFGGLNDSAIGFILDHSVTCSVASGDYFFREGDAARSLHVLISGSVIIEKNWNGVPVELRSLAKGDCFGEMAIIDLQARSASVRASTECQSIEITRATLHKLCQQDLEQYAILMMNMGREVSRRLRIASERLFALDRTLSS
jgi:CRP-like cAMP-binding protein